MSYLTETEKAAMVRDFACAMDTFLQPLRAYQEAQRVVIRPDAEFNPIDAGWEQNSTAIQNTPVTSLFSGRIQWDRSQDWRFLAPGGVHPSQMNVTDQTAPAVRVKVDYSGYCLLRDAKKVEIGGVLLNTISNPRPHGVFGTGFWTFSYTRAE